MTVLIRSARIGGVHGLAVDTDLSPFVGCLLEVVSVGQYQVNLGFDGLRKIGITIEGDFAVALAGRAATMYSSAPEGAADLASLLGSEVSDASVIEPGTTSIRFANGATITAFDSQAHYESYQIYFGERLIVV